MTSNPTPCSIHQFGYGSDNYGVLLHDTDSGATACIDAGDADATRNALAQTGWSLTHLLITHHHADHTAGLAAIKQLTGCRVIGPGGSSIKGIDEAVAGGDTFRFAGREVRVIHTPGHTMDMLNFHLPAERLVFTGDTLFVLGCGRLFEGDAATMWQSLSALAKLPADTQVYCGHEYTKANAAFAVTIDPDNEALAERSRKIDALRDDDKPTVPTTIGVELAENPFLRAGDEGIRRQLGMSDATDAQVFAEIRERKDRF